MSILDILGTAEGPFMTQWTAPATGLANFRCWLRPVLSKDLPPRPLHPQTRTFQARCPLFSELRQLHPNERKRQTHGAMGRS